MSSEMSNLDINKLFQESTIIQKVILQIYQTSIQKYMHKFAALLVISKDGKQTKCQAIQKYIN